MFTTAGLAALTITHATADSTTPPAPPPKKMASSIFIPPEHCADSQNAIVYYRRAYTNSRTKMRLQGAVARAWYPCDAARRRAGEWRDKAKAARAQLEQWLSYHYDWQKWLPANWYRVGSCETGYGGAPDFTFANGRFVSAFGISRSIYDRDAAHAGVPPWNDSNPPTPREQYLAALGHYDMFGDGWGCPGP